MLPDRTSIDDLVIRRWMDADVEALHEAIRRNVEHLRPRMAWIAEEPASLDERRARVAGWNEAWAAGGDAYYGIWRGDRVVGSTGLHHRGWPDGPEIGYWVDGAELGQGIATLSSQALTDLAFTVAGVDAVYLAHDRTNRASRRVPEKLGFVELDRDAPQLPDKIAPADDGILRQWRVGRDRWFSRRDEPGS